MNHEKNKSVTVNYRIVVNENSDLFKHIETVGEDLLYAKKEFERMKQELNCDDTICLQEEIDYSNNWVNYPPTSTLMG
jgi:hypothetical protein